MNVCRSLHYTFTLGFGEIRQEISANSASSSYVEIEAGERPYFYDCRTARHFDSEERSSTLRVYHYLRSPYLQGHTALCEIFLAGFYSKDFILETFL
jgi:hypothetical protein